MNRSRWSVIVPTIAGIAAGIASSLIVSSRDASRSDPAPKPTAEQSSQREYVPVFVQPTADPIDELRARATQPAPARQPSAQNAPAPDEPQALEQQKQATIARHEQLIRAHREQAVDGAWATRTSALLRSDLADIAKTSSFEVVEAECRTTSCIATMKWPSFGKAQTEWRQLLHHGYQANCSREITLPDPSDPSAAYQATLVLDCESARAEAR